MTAPPQMPPSHGGQLRQIAARFGIDAGQLLDFSANINPMGPPASAIQAIQDALSDPATLTTYPDIELVELKAALAGFSGVDPSHISAANGFAPLLDAALRALRPNCCLLPVPSFSEYRRTLENASITIVPYQTASQSCFRYDPDVLIRECLAHDCDAILLANPQNPSGVSCAPAEMKRLVEAAAGHRIKILLDEAFIDFCPDHSLTQAATENPALVVFRSVTKFFAIPGLRIAYTIAHPAVATLLNRHIAPWPVASLASVAVRAALRNKTYAEKSRIENEQRLCWLKQELAELDVTTYPSMANFLLLRFPDKIDVGEIWEKMIVEHHVVLRSCVNFEGLTDQHLRVAVRSEADNLRLVSALRQVLSGLPTEIAGASRPPI